MIVHTSKLLASFSLNVIVVLWSIVGGRFSVIFVSDDVASSMVAVMVNEVGIVLTIEFE